MARYRLSTTAQADLIDVLAWTQSQFGEAARKRYETLLVAALRDISIQPDRSGSVERPELGDGVRSWHLHLSRERARTETGMGVRQLFAWECGRLSGTSGKPLRKITSWRWLTYASNTNSGQ